MTATTTHVGAELEAGTWVIDTSHSDVSFSVRHLMVSKVRGTFDDWSGSITIGDDPLESSVEATIQLASVSTRDEARDNHLRSGDFFDVTTHPEMTYRSTVVRAVGGGYEVEGELSLRGVTRPVTLSLEYNGGARGPWGGTRAAFSASAEINRKDFGVDISLPLDDGGVVVGDKVTITLEIEAVLDAAA